MKKIIILKHGGGELANQLWNYLSIYAYGLEVGVPIQNPSFFEYHYFFRFLEKESFVTRLTTRLFFRTPRRRNNWINKNQRFKYAQRVWFTTKFNASCIYSSENNDNKQTYLPPSGELPERFTNCGSLYFTGWLFRNPKGLTKFKTELHRAFTPTDAVLAKINSIITPLRQNYQNIIGVHIRQADYKDFKSGKFIVNQERVRSIIDEYLREKKLDTNKTLFLLASDGKINETIFTGLNTYISKENSVIDLFLLSKTDTILGSDSSFGAFAAWYGNIPQIILKNEPVDWSYYIGKETFFENTQSELMKY